MSTSMKTTISFQQKYSLANEKNKVKVIHLFAEKMTAVGIVGVVARRNTNSALY